MAQADNVPLISFQGSFDIDEIENDIQRAEHAIHDEIIVSRPQPSSSAASASASMPPSTDAAEYVAEQPIRQPVVRFRSTARTTTTTTGDNDNDNDTDAELVSDVFTYGWNHPVSTSSSSSSSDRTQTLGTRGLEMEVHDEVGMEMEPEVEPELDYDMERRRAAFAKYSRLHRSIFNVFRYLENQDKHGIAITFPFFAITLCSLAALIAIYNPDLITSTPAKLSMEITVFALFQFGKLFFIIWTGICFEGIGKAVFILVAFIVAEIVGFGGIKYHLMNDEPMINELSFFGITSAMDACLITLFINVFWIGYIRLRGTDVFNESVLEFNTDLTKSVHVPSDSEDNDGDGSGTGNLDHEFMDARAFLPPHITPSCGYRCMERLFHWRRVISPMKTKLELYRELVLINVIGIDITALLLLCTVGVVRNDETETARYVYTIAITSTVGALVFTIMGILFLVRRYPAIGLESLAFAIIMFTAWADVIFVTLFLLLLVSVRWSVKISMAHLLPVDEDHLDHLLMRSVRIRQIEMRLEAERHIVHDRTTHFVVDDAVELPMQVYDVDNSGRSDGGGGGGGGREVDSGNEL